MGIVQRNEDFDFGKPFKVKLTDEIVEEILLSEGTSRHVASTYGISHSGVVNIRNGKSWRHVYERVILGKSVSISDKSHHLAKLFDECYEPEPNTGCWLWNGGWTERKYGVCSTKKVVLAHRDSYVRHKGDIPDGLFVCHKCDTPCCVNPDHLFLGTHDENMRDMVNKGRGPTGEKNPMSKLSEAQVLYIRSSKMSQKKLAVEMGCAQSAISRIKNGLRWKHLK